MENLNKDKIDPKIIDIFFEKSPFAIQSLDENGRIIDVSSLWLSMLGYSKEEVIGRFFTDFLCEEYKYIFFTCFPKLKEMGQVNDVEIEMKKKNGDTIFVSVDGKIIYDENGNITQTFCFIHDISKHKELEKELLESETKYREILDQSPDSVLTVDLKGFITSCNASFEKFTGYSKEEVIGKHFTKMSFLKINDIPSYIKIFSNLLRDKKPTHLEISWIKKDGTVRIGEIIIGPIKRQNKLVGFQTINRDITERKRTDDKLNGIQILSKELALTNDIYLIAEKTIEVMKNVLNFDTAFFILREGDSLRAIISVGIPEYEQIQFDINSRKGIIPWVAREGKTYLTNNTKKDKLFINTFGQKIPNSELCVPIKIEKEVLGVLNTESENLDEYTEEDVHMLEALASEVAVAVAYSKSLNRIQDELDMRKQIELALRESEEKYKELVENANSIIAKFDKESRIISMNEYGLEFFGYTKEELIGKTWIETILPIIDHNGRNLQNYALDIFVDPERYAISINENIKKNGERVWIHWTNKPIRDKKGNLSAILSVGSDYTLIKKVEDDLKESEERFRIFFEKANDSIMLFNEEDQIMNANEAASKLFGYSKEELLKMTVSDLQAPAVRGSSGTVIKSELEKYGEGEIFEALDIDKFGNIFPIEISQTLITIRGEEVVLCIVRDISERKIAEELLKKSEEKYRRIVDTSNEGIWIIDDHYITTFANSKMSEMLGYTTKEMIGKSAGIFLYDNDINPQVNRMAARTEGLSQNYELALKKKNGEKLWALVSATPILDDQGNFKGSFAMFTDITERKQNEEVIKQLNDNLKLLNKILRHDIANHLTVVSLSLEMIETNNQDIKNKAFNSIKRSVDLIEKLRTLESTMITKYDLKPVVVGQIAEFVKKSYTNVTIDLIDDCTVMADEALTSVIDNIINNAITHSKTDKIDIKITSEKDICKIKIIDYGIGIPNSIKRQIFDEEFSYGETRGTGLGLFIAKKNIERYGGEIEVKDTKPHGATFILKLKKCKI